MSFKITYLLAAMSLGAICVGSAAAQSASPGYLECDGSSRYMVIPNSDQFNIAAGGKMTVSVKVLLNDTKTQTFVTNRVRRLENGNNNDVSGWSLYYQSPKSSMSFNYPGSSWTARHQTGQNLTTGTWHHLCWVYSGNASAFYIDGVAAPTTTGISSTSAIPSYCDLLVGAAYTMTDNVKFDISKLNNFVNGNIDDVRIYGSALTVAEVAEDRTSETPLAGKSVIAAYDFTDMAGTTVPDISGNGHNGTLVGFPDYSANGSLLTVAKPENGSVRVLNGTNEVVSGSRVADGTTLTVEATPNDFYLLDYITVNGTRISGNTFTMEGETTVSATFIRDVKAPTKVLVYDMNENGSKFYRIPALVTAADGSLVAVADRRGSKLNDLPNTISVVAKRSTDGGKTWSDMVTIAQGNAATGKTYGDPAVVLDRNTGNIVVVFSGDQGFFASNKSDKARMYVSKSADNGLTWSTPKDITDQLYQSSWYGSFCASGRMLQTSDGKIMFVANTRFSSVWAQENVYEMVCCSEDGGDTWTVLNPTVRIPADGKGNESKLVEASDGSLLMSLRSLGGKRRFSKSTDGGKTWSAATAVASLPDPDCNGDVITYPATDGRSRMLHTVPANSSIRQDLSIFMSYDDGATWTESKRLIDGLSAYSSMTILPDGSIGCLVEEGKWDDKLPGDDGFRIYFMNFTIDWLTDGKDNPEYGSTTKPVNPYCVLEGNANHRQNGNLVERGISTLTVADNNGNEATITGGGTAGNHSLYTDATDNVFTTTPGSVITITNNGTGSWMSSYVYVDYNNNGQFDFVPANCDGAHVDGELVSHTGYNKNDVDPKVASDGTTINWQTCFNTSLPTFRIPADLAPGDYRIRHKMDWNCVDPCGRTVANGFDFNFIDDNGGGIIDFTIRIELPDPRTVTVSSANPELGSVKIVSPATDQLTITTPYAVEVEAEATDADAYFVNWTDAEGNVVSTEARFTYEQLIDAAFVANFRWHYAVTVVDEHKWTKLQTSEGTAVNSGDMVDHGTELTAVFSPIGMMELKSVLVNGVDMIDECTNNRYTFIVEKATEIKPEFSLPDYTVNITTDGNGAVVVAEAVDTEGGPVGETFAEGASLAADQEVYVIATPDEHSSVESMIINGNALVTDKVAVDDDEYLGVIGKIVTYCYYVDTDLKVSVRFVEDESSITEIGADQLDSNVRYFNLQGQPVAAGNLTPGFYIELRNGEAHRIRK